MSQGAHVVNRNTWNRGAPMRRIVAAVCGLFLLASLAACSGGSAQPRSSGSLAVSNDSRHLYAADTDNGVLLVLDSQTLEKVREVKVGERPFRVSVGLDDRVYVANRGSRSVSVVSHGDWAVVGNIATGVDPVGMQISTDGKTLYVVSATAGDNTEYGILQAIDTATLTEKWNLPVGDEPRGLALVGDSRALVSLYRTGEIVNVDLKDARVLESNVDVYTGTNRSALNATSTEQTRFTTPVTFHPRGMADLAATPDGTRVFATGSLSREAPILTNPTPATAYYASQGPRLAGSVVTTGVFTLDTTGANVDPKLDDVSDNSTYYGYGYGGQAEERGYPQTSYSVNGFSGFGTDATVMQGPTAAVVDVTGEWLFMVNRDTRNLAIISAQKRQAKAGSSANDYYSYNELPSVYATADLGHGADGIAILGDNTTAYVYNQFDHTVQKLVVSSGSLAVTKISPALVGEVLTADQALGRKMFFDANDRSISSLTASVACSQCHLEGRDDGHTWLFPDGPRQTPTLAGRGMAETAPYHWSGEFPGLKEFLEHTITSRMGGTGINDTQQAKMNAYVDALPAPENPYKLESPNEQQVRGSAAFQKAECGTCHSGKWLTNLKPANVGTLVTGGINPDTVPLATGLDVPSLKGLSRSAPYLHTGAARTLKERLMVNPNDSHGKTSRLSAQEMDDLVAFLRTL